MRYSLPERTIELSVGEFAGFSLGPVESGDGPQGLWRAQLGQHWHGELQKRTSAESAGARFEVPIEGRLIHRGWTFRLQGRIDQIVPTPTGSVLREVKSVLRPLPADEAELRADYPDYFLQASAYLLLARDHRWGSGDAGFQVRDALSAQAPSDPGIEPPGARPQPSDVGSVPDAPLHDSQPMIHDGSAHRAELVFVEAGAGLVQTIALTPFDAALVFHQLDALVEFLNLRLRAAERRRALQFHSPFSSLRPGQESIQADLAAAFGMDGQNANAQGGGTPPTPEAQVDGESPAGAASPAGGPRSAPLSTSDRPGRGPTFPELTGEGTGPTTKRRPKGTPPTPEAQVDVGPVPPSVRNQRGEGTPATGRGKYEGAKILLFEAPTGYGKTGCVLEFALGQIKAGRFGRLIWLTGKSTGQIQVMHTLRQMAEGVRGCSMEVVGSVPAPDSRLQTGSDPVSTSGSETFPNNREPITGSPGGGTPLPAWQVRNKGEHCVNHTFHCVRDGCDFLRGAAERWPGSGLTRFYTDERQPRDLDTLRAAGRQALVCPYEITRTALAFQDVWVGDFNYVFAPDNRGLFYDRPGFDPAETLLVVDEAHNLPSRVAGAHSLTANEGEARMLLAELDHLRAPAALLLAVEQWVRLLGSLRPADSLDPDMEDEIRHQVARLAELATTTPLDYVALGPQHSATLWNFPGLQRWLEETDLTGSRGGTARREAGASGVGAPARDRPREPALRGLLWVARAGQLEFTCIDAAAAIGSTLREFGGAILMSATLQPFAEFAESCGLDGAAGGDGSGRGRQSAAGKLAPSGTGGGRQASRGWATLQAPTPWRAGAYDVAVDLRVDTTYRNRAGHYRDTAATIVTLAAAASQPRKTDDGRQPEDAAAEPSALRPPPSGVGPPDNATRCIAVFFPSYAYAEAVLKTLEDYGSVLRVALQPRLPDLAAQAAWVEENLALSDVLFLVLGSSFAEGIDLLGGRVTHAMVVGPALPEVNAVQKAKVADLGQWGREAAFRRVYQIPGLQKVNQALGRLVRAPGQRAKVLLHCRRFAEPSYASLLASDYQLYREIATEAELEEWAAGVGRGN